MAIVSDATATRFSLLSHSLREPTERSCRDPVVWVYLSDALATAAVCVPHCASLELSLYGERGSGSRASNQKWVSAAKPAVGPLSLQPA